MSAKAMPPRWSCARPGCDSVVRHATKKGKAGPPDGWRWDGGLLCCPRCVRGFGFEHVSINADDPHPDVVALARPI